MLGGSPGAGLADELGSGGSCAGWRSMSCRRVEQLQLTNPLALRDPARARRTRLGAAVVLWWTNAYREYLGTLSVP